ncbi:MAG: hypothetical protein JRM79_03090 [Nitrososphaerota archaeon]|nr:hypothetical protein [Nitrososphaerota archaeon]MDG6912732.1 hypothetical protein [Nitrososphaerota archaeon]MDG6952517.1 hypothetical protein [Nitrososphaerota archaeon]MDG6958621.1 hypothetical protein [Nitrososphaerota archaeon]MDG6962541.1 hypothetical protein [Nitrososphaerota archaeon]
MHYFCNYNSDQPNPSATFSGVKASWNLPDVLPTPAPSGSDQCTSAAPSGGYEYLYQWLGLGGDGDASSMTTSPLVQAGISETVACTGSSLNVSFEPWFEAVSEDPTPKACPSNSDGSSGSSSGSVDAIKAGMKVKVSVEIPQNDTAKQTFEVKYEIEVDASNGSPVFICNEDEQVHLVFLGNSIEMELEVPSAGLIAGDSSLPLGSTDPAWGCPSNSNGFSLTPAFSEINVTNFQYEGGPPSPNNVFIPGFPGVSNNQKLDMNGCDPVTGSVTQIPSPLLGTYFTEDYGASRYVNSYGYSCYATQCYSYTGYFPGSTVTVSPGGSTPAYYLLGTGYSPGLDGASPIAATTANTSLVIEFVGTSETYTTTTTGTGTNNCNDTFAPVSLQYLSQGGGFGPPELSVTAKVCTPVTPGYVVYGVDFQLWYAPSATPQGGLGCSHSSCLKLWDTGVLYNPTLRVYSSGSATLVICSPVYVVTGTSATCKAAVAGSSPTGTVTWSASAKGTFSPFPSCALSSGSCTIGFTPTLTPAAPYSTVTVFATYGGDSQNGGSSGSSSLFVTTKQDSSTKVVCAASSYVGSAVSGSCTVTVTGNCPFFLGYCFPSPAGIVNWSSNGTGSLVPADCSLVFPPIWPGMGEPPGSCTVRFTLSPASGTSFTITGLYAGDYLYKGSSDTVSLTAPAKPASSTSASCTPSSLTVRASTTCTARVTGSSPTGNVTWSTTGIWDFSSSWCTLSAGSCSVTYTPTVPASPVNITATYSGDLNNGGSSGTFSLAVSSVTTTSTTSATSTTSMTLSSVSTTSVTQSTVSKTTGSGSTSSATSSGTVATSTGVSTTGSATSTSPQSGGSSAVSAALSFVAGVLIASVVFMLLIRRGIGVKKG